MKNILNNNGNDFEKIELNLENGKSYKTDSNSDNFEQNMSRSYISQKQTILNEVLNEIESKINGKIISQNTNTNQNIETKTKLNPESELITEKDPDEIIILPPDEFKKKNNSKNKNQPL